MDHYRDYGLREFVYPFLLRRDNTGLSVALPERFSTNTLVELLSHPDPDTVKIAVVCLGLTGGMSEYGPLTELLPASDRFTVGLIEHALCGISFRAGTPHQCFLLRRAVCLWAEDHKSEAMLLLNRVLVENPGFAEAHYQRALLLHLQGDYRAAIEDCLLAIELNPRHYGAWSHLGHARAQIDEYPQSLESYYAALRIHPHLEGLHQAIRCLRKLVGVRGPGHLRT